MGGKNSKKHTELKEKEIKLLIQKTGLSRQEILDWHTQFIQSHPDGLIDIAEFTTIYREFYQYGNSDNYAKFAFQAFDQDNCGKISFSEFLIATAFALNASQEDDLEKSLEFAFDVYDVDDNGKVERNEVEMLLTAVYQLKTGTGDYDFQNIIDDIFRYYDTDANGYLNKREFVVALLNDQCIRDYFVFCLAKLPFMQELFNKMPCR
ncbi:neuronal calcium sensor 2-like [Brachionus plicatilis]|uniref:Neuronal calcium sensor 2-like n=1 Tax=Brachionus plicatilis TaxID=10195 RepID=A0A3M7R3H2_BRAPC|nr:neuronal calcium sensor 2-like [Brachionus plicatilis]